MREIYKTIPMQVEGKEKTFRLKKLDAFSGASLLRIFSAIPAEADLLAALTDDQLHSLMRVCLEHCEVSLPAGWNPVMVRGEWGYPEIEYDICVCLKLMMEEILWTLRDFFGEGASSSQDEIPVIPS